MALGTITIFVEGSALDAELNDSETARKLYDALPVEGTANVWGAEIYFAVPVELEQAPDARAEVEVGELGYWPTGEAFCIFFGPTPVSTGNKPRAYSPVNVFGRIIGDASILKSVANGAEIRVTRKPG